MPMYDLWFISYDEPDAEVNWRRLRELVPAARRLAGIEGLVNAYRTAAARSRTDWFWIVDGDNWLLDASIFDFVCPASAEEGHLFVWPARNSINGLEYGNGAIKLYNRRAALGVPADAEDFSIAVCTTRIKFPQVASETRIHGSPRQAFSAGFREGFKLHRRIRAGETHAVRQYEVWTTRGTDVPHGPYAIAGARLGYARFAESPDFPINDRRALAELFAAYQQQQAR